MASFDADVLTGLGGNDTLDGSDNVDTLYGGSGDDLLYRGEVVYGGDGNDRFEGVRTDSRFQTIVDGGSGYDELYYFSGINLTSILISGIEQISAINLVATAAQLNDFVLLTGAGDGFGPDNGSVRLAESGFANIRMADDLYLLRVTGTDGDEDLVFFGGADVVFTGDYGNDRALGSFGDDRFDGDWGDDTLYGAEGNDSLFGSDGDDLLYGGAGNDALSGNYNVDIVYGGAGDDTITGSSFTGTSSSEDLFYADSIFGDDGNDTIYLNDNDTADGGSGNDRLIAAGGSTLFGFTGDDYLIASSENDFLFGGEGIDTLSYERFFSSSVNVDLSLAAVQNTGGGGAEVIAGIENLTGGGGNDTLLGTAGANVLRGLAGNDLLDGRSGVDTASYLGANGVTVDLRIIGPQNTIGAGLDSLVSIENLIGSEGADILIGSNADNVLEGAAGTDTINGQGGLDFASYATASQGVSVSLAISGPQNTIGAGIDTIVGVENLLGSALGDSLTGGDGANRLEGGLGNDLLTGGAGNDALVGGTGDDTLDGGVGGDVMQGGEGGDTYIVDSATDSATEATQAATGGNDLVRASVSFTLGLGIERLTLTGTGAIEGNGNSLNNTITGNAGGNALRGLTGNDTLDGGGGSDTIIGGGGVDRLVGGAGADRFVFQTGDSAVNSPDLIVAFDAPGAALGDIIDLSAIDANGGGTGNGTFLFGQRGLAGLWLTNSGSDTLVFGNTDADADAEFAIRIADGAATATQYRAGDFVL